MTTSDIPNSSWVFGRIETKAKLPDGRVFIGWYSYPKGVGYDEYRRIDTALVCAFGNENSTTTGTQLEMIQQGKIAQQNNGFITR